MAVYHLLFELHCKDILFGNVIEEPWKNFGPGSIGVFYKSEDNSQSGKIFFAKRSNGSEFFGTRKDLSFKPEDIISVQLNSFICFDAPGLLDHFHWNSKKEPINPLVLRTLFIGKVAFPTGSGRTKLSVTETELQLEIYLPSPIPHKEGVYAKALRLHYPLTINSQLSDMFAVLSDLYSIIPGGGITGIERADQINLNGITSKRLGCFQIASDRDPWNKTYIADASKNRDAHRDISPQVFSRHVMEPLGYSVPEKVGNLSVFKIEETSDELLKPTFAFIKNRRSKSRFSFVHRFCLRGLRRLASDENHDFGYNHLRKFWELKLDIAREMLGSEYFRMSNYAHNEDGGWLLVDVELAFDINESELKTTGEVKPAATYQVRLSSNPSVDTKTDSIPLLIRNAFRNLDLSRAGLELQSPDMATSALPKLEKLKDSPQCLSLATLFSKRVEVRFDEQGVYNGVQTQSIDRVPFRLGVRHEDQTDEYFEKIGRSKNFRDRFFPVKADLSFPAFIHDSAGESPCFSVTLEHLDELDLLPLNDPTAYLGFVLTYNKNAGIKVASHVIRVGGVAFQLGNTVFDDVKAELLFGPRRGLRPSISRPPEQLYSIRTEFTFNALTAEQITTDTTHGNRDGAPSPLIIDWQEKTIAASDLNDTNFSLSVAEFVGPKADRHLIVEVIDKTRDVDTAPNERLLIGTHPFTVMKFATVDLSVRGGSAGSVAFYDSDTRQWEFRTTNDSYRYVLPPQVIGESADKPRRLELHDWDPQVGSEPIPHLDLKGLARRAVEFRLSPGTEVWLKPSDLKRNFSLPEAAIQEILTQNNDYGRGAALIALRGEFLYGLSVGILSKRDRGNDGEARVSELGSILGDPLAKAAPGSKLADRWNNISDSLLTRPQRIEVWRPGHPGQSPFTPARFDSGVTFALRATALSRLPTPPTGIYKPENYQHDGPPSVSSAGLRWHPQGLSGGALWPVEQANLIAMLSARPESDGGEIENIALTPLGGDALQKARFLNGLVTVISETEGGYLKRHKVEVLGRISVFWHKAKHVVEYERTANIPAQFAPEYSASSTSRSRRPVLRKVREYIEILETDRRYPDFDLASPQSSGFLERIRFNARQINVDSAWGRDIKTYGWEIPLWDRYAASRRPEVYPKPDVTVLTTSEQADPNAPTPQAINNPENVFFFTRFDDGPDTQAWIPETRVDYSPLPQPRKLTETMKLEKDSPGDGNKRKQSAPLVVPGFRRFTWALTAASSRTMVNAGRADKPLMVNLETITFQRANIASDAVVPASLKNLLESEGTDNKDANDPAKGFWRKGADASVPDHVQKVHNSLTQFKAKLEALPAKPKPGKIKLALSEPANLVDIALRDNGAGGFLDGIKTLQIKAKGLHDNLSGTSQDLKKLLNKAPRKCANLANEVKGVFVRKSSLIVREIDGLLGDVEELEEDLKRSRDKETAKNLVLEKVTDAVGPILRDIDSDISGVQSGLIQAETALRETALDLLKLFNDAETALEAQKANFDTTKPWSEARLASYNTSLRREISAIEEDVERVIDDLRGRLVATVGEAGQQIGHHVIHVLAELQARKAKVIGQVANLDNPVDMIYDRAISMFAQIGDLDGRGGYLEKAKQGLNKVRTKVESSKYKDNANIIAAMERADNALAAIKNINLDGRSIAERYKDGAEDILEKATQFTTDFTEQVSLKIIEAHEELKLVQSKLVLEINDSVYRDFILTPLDSALLGIAIMRQQMTDWISEKAKPVDRYIDLAYLGAKSVVVDLRADFKAGVDEALSIAGQAAADLDERADEVRMLISPEVLIDQVLKNGLVSPAIDGCFNALPQDFTDGSVAREAALKLVGLGADVKERIEVFDCALGEALDNAVFACKALSGDIRNLMDELAKEWQDSAPAKLYQVAVDEFEKIKKSIDKETADLGELKTEFDKVASLTRGIQNTASQSMDAAKAYKERVLVAVQDIDLSEPAAAPNKILRLYSAVSNAPEIAGLEANIRRIRSDYEDLKNTIETSKAYAYLNKLGDELKALGIDLPVSAWTDRLMPDTNELRNLDLNKLFGNFGGFNLKGLFKGLKLPKGAEDNIRISNEFDKKQARAWIQLDIDVPLPSRSTLFSMGVFKMDFVRSQLQGQIRIEASAEAEKVKQTGFARIGTNVEALVSGQKMVGIEKMGINYSKEAGLNIELDPRNIKLSPSFRFIQETLSSIFGDEIGGLQIVKKNGIPVGVEHLFAMPPLGAMFGTSGISNVAIGNRFKLIAYPDFIVANRFNLSRPDLPFLFTIFIIGGTGYVQVDAEYKPLDGEMLVTVEAAAGGSASLGFSFGAVSGVVFVALSMTISYHRLIGVGANRGSGLSIGAVLVVAGRVDVAGVASVNLGITLRMTYRENGQIDGTGSARIKVKVSRFFTIKTRVKARYKLRDGRSQSVVESNTTTVPDKRLQKAQKALQKLKRARG